MARAGKIAPGLKVGLLVALLCVCGGVAYRCLHGSISTASAEQIRSVVPPELLVNTPIDSAARGRYDDLVSACLGLTFLSRSPSSAERSPTNEELLKREALVASGMQVIGNGRLQAPDALEEESQVGNTILRTVSAVLTNEARRQGAAGNREGCARAVSDGLRLASSTWGMGGAVQGYLTAMLNDRTALQAAVDCARSGWLNRNDLLRISAQISSLPESDPALAEAQRQELQRLLFRSRLGVATIGPQLTKAPVNNDERLAAYGNFDALVTAKLLYEAFQADIANDSRPWSRQDNTVSMRLNSLVDTLPEMPGWEDSEGRIMAAPIRALRYRIKMNQLPNSLGLSLFVATRPLGTALRRVSVALSCSHELARTLLAICAYRDDHGGANPAGLRELVEGHYLKELPIDRFSDAPLLYDPKRGMAYSVGPNLRDDHGNFDLDVSINELDFGYLPKPPKLRTAGLVKPPGPTP